MDFSSEKLAASYRHRCLFSTFMTLGLAPSLPSSKFQVNDEYISLVIELQRTCTSCRAVYKRQVRWRSSSSSSSIPLKRNGPERGRSEGAAHRHGFYLRVMFFFVDWMSNNASYKRGTKHEERTNMLSLIRSISQIGCISRDDGVMEFIGGTATYFIGHLTRFSSIILRDAAILMGQADWS